MEGVRNTETSTVIGRRHLKKAFKPNCFFLSKFSVTSVHLHQSKRKFVGARATNPCASATF